MPNAEKLSCSSRVCVRVSQSSVVHPLLQLVPQLHERRMKRFRLDVRNTNCMLASSLSVGPWIPSCGDVEDTLSGRAPYKCFHLYWKIWVRKCFHSGGGESFLPHLGLPLGFKLRAMREARVTCPSKGHDPSSEETFLGSRKGHNSVPST